MCYCILIFMMGKNRLSIVQITHQFKFFTLRFLSRQNVENKIRFANKIFFITSIQFVACVLRESLSNWSSGVQIPFDICTRLGRCLLHSTKCSWIIKGAISFCFASLWLKNWHKICKQLLSVIINFENYSTLS